MSKKFIYVFDIETLPDIKLLKDELYIDEKDDYKASLKALEIFKEEKDISFLPHAYHKVIAISIALLDEYGKFLKLVSLEGKNEKELVEEFFKSINKYSPKLVSFNGKGFDMSVLLLKALKYNIDASVYLNKENKWSNYLYGDDYHLDLMQLFSYTKGRALNSICGALGIPGKYEIDGEQVLNLFYANKLEKIKEYCESDVLNTLFLFYKFEFAKRDMFIDDYINNLCLIKDFLNENNKPYKDVFSTYCDEELKRLKEI